MKKILNSTNLIFILLLLLELAPLPRPVPNFRFAIGFVLLLELYYLAVLTWQKEQVKVTATGDVITIIFIFTFLLELFSSRLHRLDASLFPPVGSVVRLFVSEIPRLLQGFVSSFELLLVGFVLALAIAVPLALIIGWRGRLYHAAKPLTKVLGPIPPVVYIPYTIALLPTFKLSSMFVIFIGAFWPIFINTLNGVFAMDKKLIDSARALNVGERAMLFEIILPGTMPSILSGVTIGLTLSFILLTAAEMIGSTSGMGYYVKYFSDFADYPRVIVGIIFIGLVVTAITLVFEKIEGYLLRWRS